MQTNCKSLAGILLLAVAGCGQSDGRRALSGKVLIDGQPLFNASISFRPLGHEANTSGIRVREGAFCIAADKGLVPGRYAVAVQAFRTTGRTYDDPQRGGKMPEFEPVAFKSIDPAEIEISVGNPNEFEIQLSTAK